MKALVYHDQCLGGDGWILGHKIDGRTPSPSRTATPVNHLIGYAALLIEEDDASEADVQTLVAVRACAREVLEPVGLGATSDRHVEARVPT